MIREPGIVIIGMAVINGMAVAFFCISDVAMFTFYLATNKIFYIFMLLKNRARQIEADGRTGLLVFCLPGKVIGQIIA